jgi:hypothetical protein
MDEDRASRRVGGVRNVLKGSEEIMSLWLRTTRTCLFLLICLPTCSPTFNPSSSIDPNNQSSENIEIHVRNLNFADARLWTLQKGSRKKLGEVTGKTSKVFLVEWPIPDELQLEINFVGGGRCSTASLMTDPGDIIDFQIPGQFIYEMGRDCQLF